MTTLQNINNAQVSSREWISTGHLSQQLRMFSEFPPNKRAQNHPFSREGRPSFLDSNDKPDSNELGTFPIMSAMMPVTFIVVVVVVVKDCYCC